MTISPLCRPFASLNTGERIDFRPLGLLQGGLEQPRRLAPSSASRAHGTRSAAARGGEKGLWNSYPLIREDPHRRGLLYVGTETGLYVSLDDGASWQSLRGNLPVVPVYDLVMKDNDLVLATHGRSFWILDDLTPLYQYTDQVATAPVHLYTPRLTYRSVPPLGASRPAGPGKITCWGWGMA